MAEDIVVRLRKRAQWHVRWGSPETGREFTEAAAEIERLRGGWTRLGPGSLPPQNSELFELRFAQHANVRRVMAWDGHYERYRGISLAAGCVLTGDWSEAVLAAQEGWWWRLLPGGEPPTDG